MSTINYLRLADHMTMSTKKDDGVQYFRRANPDSVRRERVQMKYEGRMNMCDVCFVARAADGSCNC